MKHWCRKDALHRERGPFRFSLGVQVRYRCAACGKVWIVIRLKGGAREVSTTAMGG